MEVNRAARRGRGRPRGGRNLCLMQGLLRTRSPPLVLNARRSFFAWTSAKVPATLFRTPRAGSGIVNIANYGNRRTSSVFRSGGPFSRAFLTVKGWSGADDESMRGEVGLSCGAARRAPARGGRPFRRKVCRNGTASTLSLCSGESRCWRALPSASPFCRDGVVWRGSRPRSSALTHSCSP